MKALRIKTTVAAISGAGAKALEESATLYRTEPLARALLDALFLHSFLVLFHWALRFTPAVQPLYLLPIWYAARNEGIRAAVIMTAVVTLTLTLTPAGGTTNFLEAMLRILTFALFCRLLVDAEQRLSESTSQALIDSLTGVYNRSALKEFGDRQVRQCLLSGQELSVAVIDCDKFKKLNDEFGHAYGDHVLIVVARLLRKAARGSGAVVRTGGDEFVLLLPRRSGEDTVRLLEEVRQKLWLDTNIQGSGASISFGVANLNHDGVELDKLLKEADDKMYLSKGLRNHSEHICA